jgi:hypothetical protein
MKAKQIIKFISLLLSLVISLSSLSVSVFAEESTGGNEAYDESNGNGYDEVYDEEYYEDYEERESMNCGPPIWPYPIIFATAPLAFVFDMFNSLISGDFSVLNKIPALFRGMLIPVFG